MKKLSILTLVLLVIFSSNGFAKKKKPKGFQGKITYKISYEGRELTSQEETQVPTQQIAYYVDYKEIVKQITPMGYITTIDDKSNGDKTMIYDMMGNKFYFTIPGDSLKDKKDSIKPVIKKLDQTKIIAGYKCKKASVTSKDKEGNDKTYYIYYTEDIKLVTPDEDLASAGINGVIMETEMTLGDPDDDEALTMIITATEVKKGKVKKSEYAVPPGAKEYSLDEVKKMFGAAALKE